MKDVARKCLTQVGQVDINKMLIFCMLFLVSCAGFYTKSLKYSSQEQIKGNELNVMIEMSFTHRDSEHIIDEIEISTIASLDERVNVLKNNIINALRTANPNKTINYLKNTDSANNGCILKIKINEAFSPAKMLPFALTLGIWPYIDTREVFINSMLFKSTTLLSEANTTNKFKATASLFLLPLAPFMTIQSVEKEVWEDAYKENLSKIKFNKCE